MFVLEFLAPYVSNPSTINGVMIGLALWFLWSAASLFKGTHALIVVLDKARKHLGSSDDPLAFAVEYEKTNSTLASNKVLGARWKAFRESLVLPTRAGVPVRATIRPDQWFDIGLLRAPGIGLDPRYHAALPNLLVGAGLLFTFLGLAVALGSASDVVSGTAAERNLALQTLLATASFKFTTSVVGMFLSISYALLRKARIRRVEKALDEFQDAIERVVPLVTPVSLQIEQNRILEGQSAHLEAFSNDLAVSLGATIDTTFNERLAEHIGPLTSAIDRLSASMASSNEDAMKSMLEAFLGKLEGGTGDHMKGVADELSSLGVQLGGLREGLGDAAMRMAESADAMARRMGEGAEAALARITDQMGGLADSLRAMADQTRESGAEASGAMIEKITAAANGFEEAAGRTATTLADAATAMERRMSEQAGESSQRLGSQLESMVAELRALAEASRETGSQSLAAVARQVGNAAATFETTAARMSDTLAAAATTTGGAFGDGAEKAVQRIAEATEGMRDEMRGVLAELQTAIGDAGQSLRTGGSETADVMRSAIEQASAGLARSLSGAAERIVAAGDEAGAALRNGGDQAGSRLVQAGEAFGDRASGLAAEIGQLGAAAQGLAERTTLFEQAVATAAEPLSLASADIKAAGQAMRAAADPVASTARALTTGIEQMTGTAQRLQASAESAGRLVTSLDQASNRFAGLDRDLASTLEALQKGLQSFQSNIVDFVSKTDSNLGKSVTGLHALVSMIEQAIEDLAPALPERRS